MTVVRPAYFQSQVKLECTVCGAQTGAACNCGAIYEAVAEKKEQERQRIRAAVQKHREKDKEKQGSVTVTDENPNNNDAAERAEARCATDWKKFTAQEERNAVTNILEAIRGLTDEQRVLLFQTLKDSYQWTT